MQLKEGRTFSLPSYFIKRVESKFSSGAYKTESVKCFCGSEDAIPITERDRYGFSYRMVLCKVCGIMYANPRMTEESYKEFYNNEYRRIYDDQEEETKEEVFRNGLKSGASLSEFLSHFEIKPKTVLEIGCNTGAWLKPFKDQGAVIYGVDYNEERTNYGRSQGLDLITGGIDRLERLGVKADLIILHHVLEHFLDLEKELSRIKGLLAPFGTLYIGVPGLYTWDRDLLFQNAHTYQFNATTLSYVMECCGFEELYCDEHITSLWQIDESVRKKSNVPIGETSNISNHFFGKKRKVPMIKTVNKFPISDRRNNIKRALSHGFPDIVSLEGINAGQEAIIIGGGPSADCEIDKIRELHERGAVIIPIERMYQWAVENGIIPNYVVALDASDDVNEAFTEIYPGVKHLVATQCHSSVFDLLKGTNTYIFNTPQRGIDVADYWNESNYDSVIMINGGGSVTIAAMSVAMFLGMKRLHVFGFDCHITNGSYAKNITGVGAINHTYEVEIDERVFRTTSAYISFAQQFHLLMDIAKKEGMIESVKIYGDSMASAMSLEDIKG